MTCAWCGEQLESGPEDRGQGMTEEQKKQMRDEMLVQAAAKLENARVNYLMARAAYEALKADKGED